MFPVPQFSDPKVISTSRAIHDPCCAILRIYHLARRSRKTLQNSYRRVDLSLCLISDCMDCINGAIWLFSFSFSLSHHVTRTICYKTSQSRSPGLHAHAQRREQTYQNNATSKIPLFLSEFSEHEEQNSWTFSYQLCN